MNTIFYSKRSHTRLVLTIERSVVNLDLILYFAPLQSKWFKKSLFKATSSLIWEQNVGQSIADDVVVDDQLVDNGDLRFPQRQVRH